MDSFDIKRLGLIFAIEAEIEGMKAENKQREINGHDLTYDEFNFYEKAGQIREICYKHNDQL